MRRQTYVRESQVFVLESEGAPVVAFEATHAREASQLRHEVWFQKDFKTFRSNGQPLWDGAADMRVRPATAEEAESFARLTESEPAQDGIVLAYLVPLDAMVE